MFCQECGNKMEEDSKFCPTCGTETSPANHSQKPAVDTRTPIIATRPVFVPWVAVLSVLPIQLFMTVWAGGFFGGFGMFGAKALGLHLPIWSTFVFFGALAFFGVPVLAYLAQKKTYAKTEYLFYPDRLEYNEGFFTAEKKTIKYKNITEANLRTGVVQKKHGLGTIILSTPSGGMQQGVARNGIRISDIENAEDTYKKVLELIG